MDYIVQCWSDKHCVGPFGSITDCLDFITSKFVKDFKYVLAHDDEMNHTLMHITEHGVEPVENFTIHQLLPPEREHAVY